MGIFEFLRKAFGEAKAEQEKVEIKEIGIDELGNWIGGLAEERVKGAEEKLIELRVRIKDEKTKVGQRMGILMNAELRNTEVPDRVKQIMEGNRQTYLQKIGTLLKKVEVPEKFEELSGFAKTFDEDMGVFDKGIAKSHNVMSEFLIKETRDLSESVRNLDKFIKELGKVVSGADADSFDEIKLSIGSFKTKVEKKDGLKVRIEDVKKEIESREKEIGKISKDLGKAEEGKEYRKFVEVRGELEGSEKKKKDLDRKMLDSFSAIEPALKKHSKLDEEDKVAKKYLENSLDYLLTDRELEIEGLLKRVKESIEGEKFELKDKKKDKILSELERLDRSYFEDFLKARGELVGEIGTFEGELASFTIDGEIDKLKDELSVSKVKLENDVSNLGDLEEGFAGIDPEKLKKNLEWEIKEGIGWDVKIV